MPLHDLSDVRGSQLALVQFEKGDQKSKFDIRLRGRSRLHVLHDLQRLGFSPLVVFEILFAWCRHSYRKQPSHGGEVKPQNKSPAPASFIRLASEKKRPQRLAPIRTHYVKLREATIRRLLSSFTVAMSNQNTTVKLPAKDLTTEFPRSPREMLGGYVVAVRALDKCRAVLAETNGEYHFNCPLDNTFFEFTGISGDDFKEFVATGADDDAVGKWIQENSKVQDKRETIAWNNKMRDLRLVDMPIELQEFLEGYIPQYIPSNKIVRVWFDVYDIEEGRI